MLGFIKKGFLKSKKILQTQEQRGIKVSDLDQNSIVVDQPAFKYRIIVPMNILKDKFPNITPYSTVTLSINGIKYKLNYYKYHQASKPFISYFTSTGEIPGKAEGIKIEEVLEGTIEVDYSCSDSTISFIYYEDGKLRYAGNLLNGIPHGSGEFYDQSGFLRYSGEWKNGNWNGEGRVYIDDGILLYSGGFQDNKQHGEGITYFGVSEIPSKWNNGEQI